MPTWIRFRYENGDSALVNAEETHIFFKSEETKIELLPVTPFQGREAKTPLCVFTCDYPEQVMAAEEIIFDALSKQQSVTITLDQLDEHADYLNNVQGIRTILSLIHQGSIRIPKNEDFPEQGQPFNQESESDPSEISRFESLLFTYLDVPEDILRRALDNGSDAPFSLREDHEECPDHGFHEYWIVETRPDRNYAFREKFDELARSLQDKEGFGWRDSSPDS